MAVDLARLNQELKLGTGTPTGAIADVLGSLLTVGTALVSEYAPDAPTAVADEATVRVVGYLYDFAPATRGRMMSGALFASGAAGLLGMWRSRRALPLDSTAADDELTLSGKRKLRTR